MSRKQYIEYEDGTRVELNEDDAPEWTEEMFKSAKRFDELPKDMRKMLLSVKRGRPVAEHPKKQVTMRLDDDVLEAFRREGAGYQTRINNVLREWAEEHGKL